MPDIRSACLTNFVEIARSKELDPYALLDRFGIARIALLDPDTRIDTAAVSALLEEAARRSGLADFGLRMAETRQVSNLGPLAFVVRQEPTVRRALQTAAHYLRLQNEAISLAFEEERGVAVIRANFTVSSQQPGEQATGLIMGVLLRTLRVLLGAAWQPRAVYFCHAAPADLATYVRVFGLRPTFAQEYDGIVFGADEMDLPLSSYDASLAPSVRDYLDLLMAQAPAKMADRMRLWVMANLPAGCCSVEAAALHVGVDRRTVHRRLAREGSSFTGIVDSVRSELALRYLGHHQRPLGEVAALLGFASQSAFSQWFRKQHGCSASGWRTVQNKGKTGAA